MKHILIIFAVLLVLMILISSFGGSIRQLTETKVLVNPPSNVGEEYNIDSESGDEKPSPYSHLEYEKAELEASSIIAPYDLVQTYATL